MPVRKRPLSQDLGTGASEGTTSGEAGAAIPFDLHWCLRHLRRNIGFIAKTVAAFLALGIVYLAQATPIYTATGELIFDLREPKVVTSNPILQSLGADQYVIDSQVEVVRSLSVARQVITKLSLRQPPSAEPTFLRRLLSFGSTPKPAVVDEIPQSEYEQFLRRLTVQRKGLSFVILVSYSHRDPVMAARITNAVMEAYTSEQRRVKVETITAANAWLQQRVEELRQRVIEAERKVQQFKTEDAAIDAKVMSTIYATFLTRLKETQSQEALQTSDARIVSAAVPPTFPSSPKKPLTLGLALALGFSLGAMIALLRGMFDPVIYDAEDLPRLTDLPVLAELPFRRPVPAQVHAEVVDIAGVDDAAAEPVAAAPTLIRSQDTEYGQAVFALRQALIEPASLERSRLVAVVSPRGGEGKTTTAVSLARESAASGIHTLLVDANLRRADASELVAPGSRPRSLVEVVEGGAELKDILIADHDSPMTVCPAPDSDHVIERPSNVLSGRGFLKMAHEMRREFELVVLDTPAFLDYPDARAMLSVLDRILIVVDLGHTESEDLKAVIKAASVLPHGQVGLVLNRSGRLATAKSRSVIPGFGRQAALSRSAGKLATLWRRSRAA